MKVFLLLFFFSCSLASFAQETSSQDLQAFIKKITDNDQPLASGAGNGGDLAVIEFIASARSILAALKAGPAIPGVDLKKFEDYLNNPNLVVLSPYPLVDKYGLPRETLNFPLPMLKKPLILLDKVWEEKIARLTDLRALVAHEMFEVMGLEAEHSKVLSAQAMEVVRGLKLTAEKMRLGDFEHKIQIQGEELLTRFNYGQVIQSKKQSFQLCLLHLEIREDEDSGLVEVKFFLEGRSKSEAEKGNTLYQSKVYYPRMGEGVAVRDYLGYREQMNHMISVLERFVGETICPAAGLDFYRARVNEIKVTPLYLQEKYGKISLSEGFSVCLLAVKSERLAGPEIQVNLHLKGINGRQEKILYAQSFRYRLPRPMALSELAPLQAERSHFLDVFRKLAEANVCSYTSYLIFKDG